MFQDQGSGNFGFAETKLLRDIHFCYRKRSGGGGGSVVQAPGGEA